MARPSAGDIDGLDENPGAIEAELRRLDDDGLRPSKPVDAGLAKVSGTGRRVYSVEDRVAVVGLRIRQGDAHESSGREGEL